MRYPAVEERLDFATTFVAVIDILIESGFMVGDVRSRKKNHRQIERFKRDGSSHVWLWNRITFQVNPKNTRRPRYATDYAKIGGLVLATSAREVLSEWELRVVHGEGDAFRYRVLKDMLELKFGVTVTINPTLT